MISMFHNLIDKYCDKVYNGNFVMIRKINVDTHISILQCFEYFMKMIRWKLIIYVNVNYVILDHRALICMNSYTVSLDYWRLSWVCRKYEPWKLIGETRFNPMWTRLSQGESLEDSKPHCIVFISWCDCACVL